MTKSPLLFGVFPYLCLGRRIRIRGITLRSSDDLADLEPENRHHLETLCSMFFAGHDVQINRMTCSFVLLNHESHYQATIRQLYEVRLLLGYLYASPTHLGNVLLPAESSSLFVFRPEQVPSLLAWHTVGVGQRTRLLAERKEPETGVIEGYEGNRNLTNQLWVAEGSRIYPELHHCSFNYSQEIADNLDEFLEHKANWAFWHLFGDEQEPENSNPVRRRIFDALEWYLRSCRGAIEEAEALVHLAIALETLLKVPGGKDLTERFKNAVLTLIGPVPRLDSWLEQFYTARSKAVHEGVPPELAFLSVDVCQAKKAKRGDEEVYPHGTLIVYGRRIFRLCLTNILSASENVATYGLEKLFVPNAERLSRIRKLLSEKNTLPDVRLTKAYGLVGDLLQFQSVTNEPHVTFTTVLQITRQLLKVFLESKPTLSNDADTAIRQFVSKGSESLKHSEQLAAIGVISAALDDIDGPRTGQHHVVTGFLQYAMGSPFKWKCLFEDNPKR